MNCLFAYCTDQGEQKSCNQDSLLFRQMTFRGTPAVLAVLCDGMGGLKLGEEASASLVRAFVGWSEQELPEILSGTFKEQELRESWGRLLGNENERLMAFGDRQQIQMGTTVTALLFCRGMYYLVHVGDCRAYEITCRVRQLTKDQTLAGREVEQGHLSKEKAAQDRRRHILLQCIGASDRITPAYAKGRLLEDAVYVLCCDGFWHAVSEKKMQKALFPCGVKEEGLMERRLRGMVSLGRERGERDDITVMAMRFYGGNTNA